MTGHVAGRRVAPLAAPAPGADLPLVRAAGPARGYCNIFGTPAKGDRYTANKLIAPDGTVDAEARDKLHRRMAELAHRIRKEAPIIFDGTAVGAGAPAPIPSGYTYLLQFIAHDTVDSTLAVNASGGQLDFAFANARARPLCLDTIYGSGPDEAPHAYEPTADDGTRPRTRLRIGPPPPDAPAQGRCLRGDIGRAVNAGDALDALKAAVGEAIKPPQERTEQSREAAADQIVSDASCNWSTQPLIADPRNDAHALMSQMTVLFHRLHNVVMDMVDPPDEWGTPPIEKVYRRFLCARTAVTLVYREIILKDVLARVLHGPVYEHYIRDWKPLCDKGNTVPIEFSHGAFRFGHAMVREEYSVNDRAAPLDLRDAMKQTSAIRPGTTPLTGEWIVDWDRFFFDAGAGATNGQNRNIALGLCPHEGKTFQDLFESKNPEADWRGLVDRDLLGACYAGLWSVPKLMARMRKRASELPQLDADHLKFNEYWRPRIKAWLKQHNDAAERFDTTQWPKIAADPPLPFFVLFEAMEVSNGLRLGPLGSIIVAETVRGAIERAPLAEPVTLDLAQRLKNCAAALLPDKPGVLDSLAERRIETMPQLLDFLAGRNAFAVT